MAVQTRLRAGDPLARAARECGLAVEGRGELEPQPRTVAGHTRNEADVQLPRLVFGEPDGDVDARGAERFKTLARYLGIRIDHRGDHPGDFRRDERIDARRRAAMVITRLERDIHGGARSA